jgi:hypothetical protein
MICANCKEPKAHRSHSQGFKDWLYKRFQLIPYRCKGCKARFYAYRAGEESSSLRTGEERKIMQLRRKLKWKRTKKELAVFAVGMILLFSMLFMALQQHMSEPPP